MKQFRRFAGISASMVLALMTQQSLGADLRVRVFERGGTSPMAEVAVCVGTQAKPEQFGAVTTDVNGYARFEELPRAQLLVTASRSGYKSEQELLVTSNTDRMLVLSMSRGGGGPGCRVVQSGNSVGPDGPVITSFTINRGAAGSSSREVSLNNKVSGQVTQYRASERADLADAQWQEYSTAPTFTLSEGDGSRTVYFQVRRHSELGDAVVESLSKVVRDAVMLKGN